MKDAGPSRTVTIVRWIARIWGTILAVVSLIALVSCAKELGHAAPDLLLALALFIIVLTGTIIAWWREEIGSGLALLGLIALTIMGLVRGVINLRVLLIALVWMLPLLLFLFCWWKTRKLQKAPVKSPLA